MLAGWRLSLRRTRADWPIVAAAWLITLLATMLFAAGPIYSSAAALAGLRRTLVDAPPADTSVQVSLYGTPSYIASVDSGVQSDLNGALSPLSAAVVRDGRAAATLAFQDLPTAQKDDRAAFGFLDGLPDHAHLIAGEWPQAGNAGDPLPVVIADAAAKELGLSVGDQLTLVAPSVNQPVPVPVRVSGIFDVNEVTDAYWYSDPQLTAGIIQNGSDRTFGPFLTTPEGILNSTALTSVKMNWRAFPNFDDLTVDNVAGIHSRLDALPGQEKAKLSGSQAVATGLPDILGGAERSLLVSRTEVLLVMAQLAIMAAYAIVLTASLLVDHRRLETALLRSRGSGVAQIAWLSFTEGLLLVIPAVLIAPWLAVALSGMLDVAGPLADIGLKIEPHVTSDAYGLAIAAGVVCLVLLVLPAFLAARSLTSEERDLSRQETRTFGSRMGLDIALLAISLIALWQLRLYGAPLTRTVQGSLGFDPLLVAAPAIGLLAGGILALRVLPILARAMEKWISRGREVVASLGSRQLARRPLRYTRTALLLMLALSLGVFAVAYSATWASSQQDQAAFQAGADVRAAVSQGPQSQIMVPADYAAIPGVQQTMPVERIARGVALHAGSVDLLALNSDAAASIVHMRDDLSTQPLDALMTSLHDGRPSPALVALPPDSAYLRVVPLLDIHSIVQLPSDFDDTSQPTPLDPATLTGVTLGATAIIRDAHGLIYRIVAPPVDFTGPDTQIVIPLVPSAPVGSLPSAQATSALDGPLELAGVEVNVGLPNDTLTEDAQFGVSGLSTSSASTGPWTELPAGDWQARMSSGRGGVKPVGPSAAKGTVVQVGGDTGTDLLSGGAAAGRVAFLASDIATFDGPVPVIANPAFLAAVAAAPGETVDVTIDGIARHLTIAGTVDAFPTTDPTKPILVFDQPTLDLLRLQATTNTRPVDEWWMSVAPNTSAQVAATLNTAPFNSAQIVTTEARTKALSTDPVALGIIGALLLGFVATGIFALVALVVSAAVSARQRRTEFSLLRALGLSGRQLSGWLWLENASVVVVSLIAGTIIGVVISWIALPFITVTQQASTPVPGVQVYLPWDRILALDLIVVVALGIAVAILAVALRRIGVGSILRLGED